MGDDLAEVVVVGVARGTLFILAEPDAAEVYQPLRSAHLLRARLLVRTRIDAAYAAPLVVGAIRALDSDVVVSTSLARDDLAFHMTLPRMMATMAGLLGAIALGLAFTGVFGLTAFAVAQRTGEIGIRMAVGARPVDVVRLMLKDNLRPVIVGLLVGLGLALAGGRILSAVLYGIDPHDPLSILLAVGLLFAAATLAAALPARRAFRFDPASVLRES